MSVNRFDAQSVAHFRGVSFTRNVKPANRVTRISNFPRMSKQTLASSKARISNFPRMSNQTLAGSTARISKVWNVGALVMSRYHCNNIVKKSKIFRVTFPA